MQPLLLNKHPPNNGRSSRGSSSGSRLGSRVSSGSTSASLNSKTGVMGSSRCSSDTCLHTINLVSRSDSSNSGMTIVSLRKRTSYLQARINSAKKKSQTDLINNLSALKIEVQVNMYVLKEIQIINSIFYICRIFLKRTEI